MYGNDNGREAPPAYGTLTDDHARRFRDKFDELVKTVEESVVGPPELTHLAMVCVAAEGHLLVEGYPGVGKTRLASAMAAAFGGVMRRIQFTPDLMPADVTGSDVLDHDNRATFQRGPIFANVVLADEINRASPKTQAALLEVMQERQVSSGTGTYRVEPPFIVLATQNPADFAGTYELPEAEIDRFMMRLTIDYPESPADEVAILTTNLEQPPPPSRPDDQPILDPEIINMIGCARAVTVEPNIRAFIADLVRATRVRRRDVRLGVSPRGGLMLARAAQAHALAQNRTFVADDDVVRVASPVLEHRILLGAPPEDSATTARDVLHEILDAARPPRGRRRR